MHSRWRILVTALLLGLFLHATVAASRDDQRVPISISDVALTDAAGKPWSLAEQKNSKVIVVVFLGTECPINNAYAPRLAELHKEYAPRGVLFVGINANCHDTPARVAGHAKEHGLPFHVLKDTAGTVADQFGARRTPETFLLDDARRIVYQGRIDDQFGIGYKRKEPTRRDLALALDEVLADKPVTVAKTTAAGCLIARATKPKVDGPVTFTKTVSRILQKSCQSCHRTGQVGPMPLLTYEDAQAWSETIKEVVAEGRMPPWHADPKHGSFANDRRLAAGDKAALLAWIDGGCPRGDAKDLPVPKAFPEGWSIGKPDAVFTMTKPCTVPAKAGPRGVAYQYFLVPTNFTEDKWVQAAEAKPGSRGVVHHIIVYVKKPGPRGQRNRQDGIGDGFLTAYAPGDIPTVLEPGAAKLVPKGSDLIFQMHYTPNGLETTDRSSVGLIFAKDAPKYEVRTRGIAQEYLGIPKGANNHEVQSATTFPRDTELLGFLPHMHLRGKDFEYRAVYPDGKSEVLMRVPRYDFNWQSNYRLKTPLHLPAGTRIECTAHYDNSADNPNNPDPTKTVFWGDQTWEEMMIGFVDYVDVGAK